MKKVFIGKEKNILGFLGNEEILKKVNKWEGKGIKHVEIIDGKIIENPSKEKKRKIDD